MMVDGVVEAIPRGSLVDVRLRTSTLDDESRRNIAGRLKSRANTAYAQIRDVESFANLRTCRREHLLRHFGDMEEVAPCAGCDVCLGEIEERVTTAGPRTGVPEGTLSVSAFADLSPAEPPDADLFERLRSWRGEQAKKQRVPAYVVLHNSHLEDISRRKPRTIHELGAIKGVGLRRAARYGDELLALVRGEDTQDAVVAGDVEENGFRAHLETADRLLRSGRGADAVPELTRALELGGDEARREVDDLLGTIHGS
jgi:ATP-dependent DNA helicase RecQ